MLVALDGEGNPRIARDTEREAGPFCCPSCRQATIIRKGQIKSHHFAHERDKGCIFSNESQEHYEVKYALYDALMARPECTGVQMERAVKESRPDITLRIRNIPVAVEIQKSHLSWDTCKGRTEYLSSLGIYTVWVMVYPVPERDREARFPEWQRNLFEWYGSLYWWVAAGKLWPYYLQQVIREKTIIRNDYGFYMEKPTSELVATKTPRLPSLSWDNHTHHMLNLVDDFEPAATNGSIKLWRDCRVAARWPIEEDKQKWYG